MKIISGSSNEIDLVINREIDTTKMSRSSRSSSVSSKAKSRSRSRSRSSRSSHSRSPSIDENCRLHVADLGQGVSKNELTRVFEKYGPLKEVWVASSPPCFAFVVFENREDAEEAIQAVDNTSIGGHRVRVSVARPRTRGRGLKSYDPNQRCYTCGERGHFSRDCSDTKYGYKRPSRRSPPYRARPRRYNNYEDFRRHDRRDTRDFDDRRRRR